MSFPKHNSDNPRLRTQARVSAEFIVQALQCSFLLQHPADRCLRRIFYANRQLGARDRRLISETFYSALRWWGWLQHLAPSSFQAACKKAPLEKLPDKLFLQDWYALLASAWLLEGTARLPAVSLWIKEAKLKDVFSSENDDWQKKARNLATFCRNPALSSLSAEDLIPAWTKKYLLFENQANLADFISFQQQRPPLWLRAQTKNIEQLSAELETDGVTVSPHKNIPTALRCHKSSLNLPALKSFKRGAFEIQDIASQNVALICAPEAGEQWWDACAGAGGKTLHLAYLMQKKGSVTATDIRAHILQELKLRARRAEFPNIRCREWKGKAVPKWKKQFDGVLVDAPCTGSGTWRRNPAARWITKEKEIKEYAALQKQLLQNASEAVKTNGTLVYATCSIFKEENQEVIKEFLKNNSNYQLQSFICPLDGKSSKGMRQIWHWQANCDAMFVAKLVRRE